MKVQFNKSENPFEGMINCLRLFQNAPKGDISSLVKAWGECKTKEQKAMFFSLCFSIGDIPRQHNIFERKVLLGGHAQREAFRKMVPVLLDIIKSERLDKIDFLMKVVEYTVADNIFATRVQTKKGTEQIIQSINMPKLIGVRSCAQVAANLYNGTTFQKVCLAKFLPLPTFRKHNIQEMTTRVQVLTEFCKLVGLSPEQNFKQYYHWRKQYNREFESVLFSTKEILKYDKEQFFTLLNKIPAGARYRIKRKVKGELNKWYEEWKNYKETKQKEQRSLEEKIRQGYATDKEKASLKKLKKEAKVTSGGFTFNQQTFAQVFSGNIDEITAHAMLEKVRLPYNTLVFIDDSGSMSWMRDGGSGIANRTFGFTARQFAAALATICLMKNPDDEARSTLGLFSSTCRMFSSADIISTSPNRLLKGTSREVNRPLINPTASFLQNLRTITGFLDANSSNSSTNVDSISNTIVKWIDTDHQAKDILSNYPVWTIISDGNFNNMKSVGASLGQMMAILKGTLGFAPVILLIDVGVNNSASIEHFIGLDNVLYVPPTPGNIETILTNFNDLDTADVYFPLLSLYREPRYEPIRSMILQESLV